VGARIGRGTASTVGLKGSVPRPVIRPQLGHGPLIGYSGLRRVRLVCRLFFRENFTYLWQMFSIPGQTFFAGSQEVGENMKKRPAVEGGLPLP